MCIMSIHEVSKLRHHRHQDGQADENDENCRHAGTAKGHSVRQVPLDRKGNYEFMSRLAQVKQYIDQNYSRGEVIFTEDVHDAFKWETFDRYPR